MPHASLKLMPGVDVNKTPTLNEAAISACNLVRFVPDRTGLGLVQKLGGWDRFYSTPTTTVARELHAWQDNNDGQHLAVGQELDPDTLQAVLGVVTDGNMVNITPRTKRVNEAVGVSTTSGSNLVTITDTQFSPSSYDSVFIATQIAVGGLILFGFYRTTSVSATTYTIEVFDVLGNPINATATVASGGAVAEATTTAGSGVVTVTMAGHGLSIGDNVPVLVPLVFDGVELYGNYTVQSVVDANNFTIQASTEADAGASAFLNNGDASYTYFVGFGAIPMGTGYGIGGYGSGGYGTGTAVTPSTGTAIPARDWTLDNWGQVLVACPSHSDFLTFTTTATSGSGTAATVTFAEDYTIPVGSPVTLTGITPSGYNGTYYVTVSSSGSITFASTTTGSQTAAGTIETVNPAASPIYYWDPTSGNPTAVVMTEGPSVNHGIFVAMPQRQIVAWGSTENGIQDPMLVRWCDVQNFFVWNDTVTNQAGSYRIPRGSRIVGGMQAPQQGLLWTDLGVWAMQYQGLPYVYGFNEIATGCGMIGRKAMGSFNGVVYWMGQSQFFQLAGGGVTPIPCSVWDVIFQQIDMDYADRIRCAVNSRFGEIAWYYPTNDSNGEVAAYVKYNVYTQTWDYGELARSAWINESVLGPPIGADPVSGYIYQHETSPNADGQAMTSYFQTGYFAISDGDLMSFIDQVWPDAKWGYFEGVQNATLNITFNVADYPGQTPRQYGPFSVTQATQFITPRLRGRLVSLYIGSSDVGSFWRLGNMRYRWQPDGKF